MKNLLFFFFLMITSGSFAQPTYFDSVNFIKPGVEEVLLDTSITRNLEPFKDADDAVIYLYRMSSMVGAAVKWQVQIDNDPVARLGQKEYITAHINTKEKSHNVDYPDVKYNYVHFKPNRYYVIRMKGFALSTGYLDMKKLSELKICKRPKK